MRTLVLVGLWIGLASLASSQTPSTAPLWNGKDLSGWHGQRHFDPYALAALPDEQRAKMLAEDDASMRQHWRCENGELINDGEGAYLTTDAHYGDAIFALEYKTVAKADSGIYLRGCPQVQIWDYTEAGGKWHLGADKGSGGLWNNDKHERFPRVLADRPFGDWNQLVIQMIGERVWVTLNHKRTVNGVRMENFWNRALPLPATGPLQLQTHGGEIRFRNLTVQELSPAAADRFLRGEEEYMSLPLGTDNFDAWQGDLDSYEIVDGAIRCRAGKGGNLFTKESFTDFVVSLRFQLPPGGNNGLAIRYPGTGNPAHAGLELQVLDDSAEKHAQLKPWQYHGSVYGVAAAARGYLRAVGEWNFQQVTVQGSRIQVELNGTLILDADIASVPSNLEGHAGKDRREGFFGFCGHNDAVAFRDLRIKRL